MQEPLILIHGEDRYLVTSAAATLRDQLARDLMSELGLEEFHDSPDVDAIERSLESLPFLALRRVVVIWDPPQALRAPRELERLLAAVSRRAETTATLIVVRVALPASSALVKGWRQLGGECRQIPRPRGRDLRRYLDEAIKARALNLASGLIPALIALGAQDLGRLELELEKLRLYARSPGERIGEAEGRMLLSSVAPQELYRLTDAIFDGPDRVGTELHGLLSRPEVQPALVIGAVARALRELLSFADPAESARWRSAPTWKLERLGRHLGRVGEARLRAWLLQVADLDWKIRTGSVDAGEGLEAMVAALAGQVLSLRR